MKTEIVNTLILAGCFLGLFGLAEILYHQLKVKVEFTRTLVHAGTGLLTLLFPVMLGNHWLVLLLCSSFALILIASLKFRLLPSINAIERASVGSIAYPVSVYGCYLAFEFSHHQYLYFYLPILILALCDPIAAFFGRKWPIGKYKAGKDDKTLMGSGMFFLSALILVVMFSFMLNAEVTIIHSLFRGLPVAFIATVSEGLSRKGFDNITIPASVVVVLFVMEHLIYLP